MGRIYITTNLLNGKVYIGRQTRKGNVYIGGGIVFNRSVKKYGAENFRKVILEDNIEDNDLINEREIYWINFFNSTNRDIGYNLTKGGGGMLGLTHFKTQETKDKQSRAMTGKIQTQEAKDKQSKAQTGRKLTPKWRANISKGNKGRVLTQKHKANISKAQQARYQKRRELAQNIDRELRQ